MTTRIAHITDLHIARPPAASEYNAKRLLGYINYLLFRKRIYREHIAHDALAKLMASPPDLVLLTGDITQHGLDSEFDGATELLAPITRRGIPIIAVPGNHDMYGPATQKRLNAFLQHIQLGLTPDPQGVFHFKNVEILPLLQGVPTPPFLSYGRQDSGELRRAREVWTSPPSNGVMRLACGHFPVIDSHGGRLLHYRGLRKAEKLVDFCRGHFVSAYFCGHNHKRYTSVMDGGCIQFAAPALSSVRNPEYGWIGVYDCGLERSHPVDISEKDDV